MIITAMQYLEPVYRGKSRGTNFEYVYVKMDIISPEERTELEKIAKKWTHTFGFLGYHKHNIDHTNCHYGSIRNKVDFVKLKDGTRIHIKGYHATEIGQEIENLPFAEFSPSKEKVVDYDLEERVR